MRKSFFLLITGIVFLGFGCSLHPEEVSQPQAIVLGKVTYDLEVRRTPEERKQGLSGRLELPQTTGMLFLFDEASYQNFWMKDMQFPLDFVWIQDGIIVGFDASIPHPAANNGEIARIQSPKPVNAVLELNRGEIANSGAKIGDRVEYLP